MPSNYTDYDPNQPLSQAQIAALVEVQKITVARMRYNKNLIEFMSDEENSEAANTLLKILVPYLCACSSAELIANKKAFIKSTTADHESYKVYTQYIETCQTIGAFDDLYFKIFMELGTQQTSAKSTKHSQKKFYFYQKHLDPAVKEQLMKNSQISIEQFVELKYYQEIHNILEKNISQRSHEFKRAYDFEFVYVDTGPVAIQAVRTLSEETLLPAVKKIAKTLKLKSTKNFSELQSNQYFEFKRNFTRLKTINEENLPNHSFESFEYFQGYRQLRRFFDLCSDCRYKGTKLLDSLKAKKTSDTSTDSALAVDLDGDSSLEPSIVNVVEQKECAAALTELATPAVVVHANENITQKLEKTLSKCVSTLSKTEEKSDSLVSLIESSEIHPAFQLLAQLKPKNIETLLSWMENPPHFKVAFNELEQIIKKLGGKIDMSKGGSHHKIIFKHSLAFVDTFEQDPATNTETRNTPKCTLVKPHGQEKSSRFLPSYSIKTFTQTLQSMGITKTILNIYTRVLLDFKVRPNPQLCLINAQIALQKDQVKMLLLLGIYKSKKGHCTNLKKLDTTPPGKKTTEKTQYLLQRVFSFLYRKKVL